VGARTTKGIQPIQEGQVNGLKATKWMVYWYDDEEWDELLLTDAPKYAEYLFESRLDCVLIPKEAYEDKVFYKEIKKFIEEYICILPVYEE
jgi:hypothetical protein